MTPSEYEALVADAVSNDFQCFENAQIFKNERFPGVRQPGKYEVDVAVKMLIADAVEYFTIFECKHLNRKVDRPIVQKVIQTRDAISAHKGVVVTNKGYTKEAIEVAQANGIGLWIISKAARVTIMGFSGPEAIIYKIVELRDAFASLVGYTGGLSEGFVLQNNEFCSADPMFEAANFIRGPATVYPVIFDEDRNWYPAFQFTGSRVPDQYSQPHLNVRHAMCEILNDVFDELIETDNELRAKAIELVDEFIDVTNDFRERPIDSCESLSNSDISTLFRSMSLPLNGVLMSLTNLKSFEEDGNEKFYFSWDRTDHLEKSTILMPGG